MELLLNIIVLVFEILYYSLFMKFSRKEGKFWKYILTFTLITIFFWFVGTNKIYSYLLLIFTILYGLKFIVKIKVSLYDMLIIFIMLLFKVFIETPIFMLFYNFLSIYIIGLIYSILKIIILNLLKNKLNTMYKVLKIKWDNNNFYIRYIFTVFLFSYTIISSIFIVLYYM